jgi:hypothetical protein
MKDCNHREGCDPTHAGREPIKDRSGIAVDAHGCDYVNARNMLIPAAERAVAAQGISPMSGSLYSRAFMTAMDRLAAEDGLVVPRPWHGAGLRAVA